VNQISSGHLLDNFDDQDGYYRAILGEHIMERYKIQSNVGKGVFSSVIKAIDEKDERQVAIKILRNNETMYKSGMKEVVYMKKFIEKDPLDRKHLLRYIDHFDFRSHLFIVMEWKSMNLRDVLRKYGRNVGLNIKAIKTYAQQLFLGLSLLKECEIVHCDIKPDNILVNEEKNNLKIADFGSCCLVSEPDKGSPYAVSRFYRAPEIIMGRNFDYSVDVWSVGCTLYELYTGQVLFPGKDNQDMLNQFALKVSFPSKLPSSCAYLPPKLNSISNPKLFAASNECEKLLHDLIVQCVTVNPDKRFTGIKHPFFTN
jgi:serine/threonine-protein kinase PRP4